jgi:hypothetical protein
MRRTHRALAVALVVLLTSCSKAPETADTTSAPPTASAPAPQAGPVPDPPELCTKSVSQCNGKDQCAAAPLTAAAANIPTGVRCTPLGEGGGDAQKYVDAFSWNLFLSLNWPANTASCAADTAKSILDVRSGDGTYVVWQTYMAADRVFVNPGYEKPAPWCSGNNLTASRVFDDEAKAVKEARELGGDFLKISEPGKDVLQAKGGVVTDQNGRWLRYERVMNQIEYDYIVDGKWNMPLLEAMQKNNQTIAIPANSIELKSAWKVLTDQEASSSKYFTTQGLVCNNPEGERTPCDEKPVTMGLVGLHIVQQVTTGGPMFWATFEHNDNDTVFFNPASTDPVNTDFATEPYTELDASCKAVNKPTQIKRETPVPADPLLNGYYQQLLGSSVFANYRLISTQWSTGVAVGGTPQHVANIVLETYAQTISKGSATGCFTCHLNATTRVKGQSANHSFLFLEAKYATMPPRK